MSLFLDIICTPKILQDFFRHPKDMFAKMLICQQKAPSFQGVLDGSFFKQVHHDETLLEIHTRKLRWNLNTGSWKGRFLLETIIFRFHVSLHEWWVVATDRKLWRSKWMTVDEISSSHTLPNIGLRFGSVAWKLYGNGGVLTVFPEIRRLDFNKIDVS